MKNNTINIINYNLLNKNFNPFKKPAAYAKCKITTAIGNNKPNLIPFFFITIIALVKIAKM